MLRRRNATATVIVVFVGLCAVDFITPFTVVAFVLPSHHRQISLINRPSKTQSSFPLSKDGNGEGFAKASSSPSKTNEQQQQQQQKQQKKQTKKKSKKETKSSGRSGAEFELQEMKVNIREMISQGIQSRYLDPTKRKEIESYVRAVASRIDSPIPIHFLSNDQNFLVRGSWRLAFSTEGATLGDLPKDTAVYVRILDEQILDYELEFTDGPWGLKSLTARSKYTVDPGPANPGLVTFVYDQITTDLFGRNLPVGFFGLLKGRANYIETAWFDGTYWIDRGFSPKGEEYFNVYVKDEDGMK